MSGWKKYGGTSQLEKTNNLTVKSLVTDNFSLRKFYLGDWDICGGLRVKDNAIIYKDTDLCGNLIVGKDTTLIGEFSVSKDTNLYGNLVVLNDAYFANSVYFDPCGNTLLNAINGGFGFNKFNPLATIDISSDRVQTVAMKTSTIENRNIYAQNVNSQGIVAGVDSGNAYINMFVDNAMNSVGTGTFDAQLRYSENGKFYIDVTNTMNVRPRTIFSSDLTHQGVVLPGNDTDSVVIYDRGVSDEVYLQDVYMDSTFQTGTPLTLISKDVSSNAFMRTTNEMGNGFAVGGGEFEGQLMGSMNLVNGVEKYPSMNIFSGDLDKYLKTSIGINKHRVSKNVDDSNRYVLDVNGPTKMIHQELLVGLDVSMQIFAMKFSIYDRKIGYAIGSPFNAILNVISPTYERYFLKTLDGGYTWTRTRIILASTGLPDSSLESVTSLFYAIHAFSDNFVVIGGQGGFLYYTINGGVSWTKVSYNVTTNFNIVAIFANTAHSNTILCLSGGKFIDTTAFTNMNSVQTVIVTQYNSGLGNIFAVDGYQNVVYMVGDGGIQGYTLGTGGVINAGARFFTSNVFADVSVYYGSDGKYHSVAVGNGVLKYVHASSITDAWLSPITSIGGFLNSVYVFSEIFAIAVGNDGLVMYSVDGFVNWKTISHTELDAMGNGSIISGLSLSNIYAVDNLTEFTILGDITSFIGGTQQGRAKVLNFYAPYFFNRANNYVLEASGSVIMSGDFHINDNGNIFTNSQSISVFPNVATEINMGNTAIGGNTNLRNNLFVVGNARINEKLIVDDYTFLNSDVSVNANLYVFDVSARNMDLRGTRNSDGVGSGTLIVQGGASIGKDLNVNGNLYINNYLDVVDGTDHIHFGYTNTKKIYMGSSDNTDEIRIGTSVSLTRGTDVDIYIGSETHSRVHILGNLLLPGSVTFQNQTNLEILNKNILLNDEGVPGSSYGAGLYIREDGSDTAGQILVNPNMTGFFLKAPRSSNTVNFDTNGMILPAGLGRGILTIVPTTSLDGSNFTVARGVVDISDIQLLDASLNNRVMRNPVTTATQVNTQVIDGKLSMTGLYINKLEAAVTSNAQVDITGNIMGTRIGLGTSSVRSSYALDVSGNIYLNGFVDISSGNLNLRNRALNFHNGSNSLYFGINDDHFTVTSYPSLQMVDVSLSSLIFLNSISGNVDESFATINQRISGITYDLAFDKTVIDNSISANGNLAVSGNTEFSKYPVFVGTGSVTLNNQFTTKSYVDNALQTGGGTILLSSNNTWSGNNNFSNYLPQWSGAGDGYAVLGNQFTTKSYVDNALLTGGGTILLSSNNNWTGNNQFSNYLPTWTGVGYPTQGNQFATKSYVDAYGSALLLSSDNSFNGNNFFGNNVTINKKLVVNGDVSFNGNLSIGGAIIQQVTAIGFDGGFPGTSFVSSPKLDAGGVV